MRIYTSDEIQEISLDFRDLAKRLLRTDYSQCDANLIRFMNFIDNNELISSYIKEKNTKEYDIETIIKSRGNWNPFEISPIENEEISFEYQLLKHSHAKFGGDFTRLYGIIGYIKTKGSYNDHLKDFSEHIIDPLVDYINKFLAKCYNQAKREEEKNNPSRLAGNTITANNSTVLFDSQVSGDVSSLVIINNAELQKAIEGIENIESHLDEIDKENQQDFIDLLNDIKEDIRNQKKPKKSLLTALKALAAGTATIVPLITELLKILFPSGTP